MPPIVRRVGMVDLARQPGFASVVLAGDFLVMSHSTTNTVDVFDIAKRRIVAQVENLQNPAGLAVDAAAGKVYVANRGTQEIAVISTSDWKVQSRIPLKTSPRVLLLVPKSGMLYSANWHHRSLSVVDLKQQTARTVPIEGSPEQMAFDAERNQLYVTLQDVGAVAVLSPALEEKKRFVVQGSLPTGIAFDAASQQIYVAVREAIVALNPDTGQEVNRATAPAGVDTLQLTANRLYAAASGGSVLIYRTGRGGLTAEHSIPTGVQGNSVAYHAARNLLLLPGGRDGGAKLLLLQPLPQPNSSSTGVEAAAR